MLTAAQMKAARALVGMDQKTLAELSGVSLPAPAQFRAASSVVMQRLVTESRAYFRLIFIFQDVHRTRSQSSTVCFVCLAGFRPSTCVYLMLSCRILIGCTAAENQL